MLEIFANYSDLSLLLVRLVVAAVFAISGWKHVRHTSERAESIGMSKSFTAFLGVAELLGAAGLVTGALAEYAALGLMLVMLGAMYKKALIWKTGFMTSNGWHYELMIFVMNSVILTIGPGALVLF